MRVCVYGAGAVGGHIAARLAEGGAEVSVVARGANLAAMRANGLVVHAADREMRAKVAASDNPADLGPQDAVIVTTKAPALPAVAAGIAPLLGPETPVVFAMNGIPWWYFDAHGGALNGRRLPLLDPGEALRDAVDPARVIGCVVYSACTVLAPGIIEVENPRSRLIFGEPDGRLSERAADLAKILFAGGLDMQLTAEIRQAIWAKLLMNLSSGPIAVLSQAPPKGFYEEPAVMQTVRMMIEEGLAVATALGCAPEIDVEANILRGQSSTHKPSILQDLELGRPMEIDGIYSSVLELARLVKVPTPTLDLLVALTKVKARAAGLYSG